MAKKRVAIIGAGASGLPSIRHALAYDVEPVCFESSNDIGGLWRYKPYETKDGTIMKTTVINTSKEMTAYSDYPPPDDFANFMHHTQMLKYFELYADNFGLRQYIRFKHRVINVERSSNFESSKQWIVHFEDDGGLTKSELFDAVLLCTGHHFEPYYPPKWPGQDKFEGRITHAHDYRDFHSREDKVITVVGVGNSGFDIAVELSKISKQVILATGYSFGFPLADSGRLIPVEDNHVDLYKLMYPPENSHANNLAVIGLIQPIGSIMPISEQQARLFFHVLTGKSSLPGRNAMRTDIKKREDWMGQTYVKSRRHTIQVDYDDYMDELAELMDCKPRPAKYLLTDPVLAFYTFFGPNLPYNYRLEGFNKWENARQAIVTCDERVLKGLRQRIVPLQRHWFGSAVIISVLVLVFLLGKLL